MAKKKILTSLPDAWNLDAEKKGATMTGSFLGAVNIPAARKNASAQPFFTSYRFRLTAPLTITDKLGKKKQKAIGDAVCVAGAMLSTKMDQVPTNEIVTITYLGKIKVGNGDAHDFDVEVDDGVELLDPHAQTGEV